MTSDAITGTNGKRNGAKKQGEKLKVSRFTFTCAHSMLWYNFTKMPQVELRALVEKKQSPKLIDDGLESFGFVGKPRRRGEESTIAKFNILTQAQHDCENKLSALSMQNSLPSGTGEDQGNSPGKVITAKRAAMDTEEPERRYASYSGSYFA